MRAPTPKQSAVETIATRNVWRDDHGFHLHNWRLAGQWRLPKTYFARIICTSDIPVIYTLFITILLLNACDNVSRLISVGCGMSQLQVGICGRAASFFSGPGSGMAPDAHRETYLSHGKTFPVTPSDLHGNPMPRHACSTYNLYERNVFLTREERFLVEISELCFWHLFSTEKTETEKIPEENILTVKTYPRKYIRIIVTTRKTHTKH